MIAMVMIIVSIRLAAQAPGDGIVGVARHDIARGGLRNQAIRVLLKQESLADLVLGGMPHYAVVSLLASVALLDRAARIAARRALESLRCPSGVRSRSDSSSCRFPEAPAGARISRLRSRCRPRPPWREVS